MPPSEPTCCVRLAGVPTCILLQGKELKVSGPSEAAALAALPNITVTLPGDVTGERLRASGRAGMVSTPDTYEPCGAPPVDWSIGPRARTPSTFPPHPRVRPQ